MAIYNCDTTVTDVTVQDLIDSISALAELSCEAFGDVKVEFIDEYGVIYNHASVGIQDDKIVIRPMSNKEKDKIKCFVPANKE